MAGSEPSNIVKFGGLQRCTAEFLALSRQNSESAEIKILAGW